MPNAEIITTEGNNSYDKREQKEFTHYAEHSNYHDRQGVIVTISIKILRFSDSQDSQEVFFWESKIMKQISIYKKIRVPY
jgi:hypothetical protein